MLQTVTEPKNHSIEKNNSQGKYKTGPRKSTVAIATTRRLQKQSIWWSEKKNGLSAPAAALLFGILQKTLENSCGINDPSPASRAAARDSIAYLQSKSRLLSLTRRLGLNVDYVQNAARKMLEAIAPGKWDEMMVAANS